MYGGNIGIYFTANRTIEGANKHVNQFQIGLLLHYCDINVKRFADIGVCYGIFTYSLVQ